ncbi:MAG: helix-turn-helix transcriptional regulator [Pseudomonadota bacterium]
MSNPEATIIAENLRWLMTERRLTAEELAYSVGISPRTVSNLRAGKNNPNERTLRLLEEFFGVPLSRESISDMDSISYGMNGLVDTSFVKEEILGNYIIERPSAVNHDRIQVSFAQIVRDSFRSINFTEHTDSSEITGNVEVFQSTRTFHVGLMRQIFPSSYVMRIGKNKHRGVFSTFQLEPPSSYHSLLVPAVFTKTDVNIEDLKNNEKYGEPLSSIDDLMDDFEGSYIDPNSVSKRSRKVR